MFARELFDSEKSSCRRDISDQASLKKKKKEKKKKLLWQLYMIKKKYYFKPGTEDNCSNNREKSKIDFSFSLGFFFFSIQISSVQLR